MAAPRTLVVDVLKESAVDTVTVYSDRAEVVRLFKNLKLQEGQTEIAINGVVDLVQDSIRVEGRGKGCSILDVTFSVKYVHRSRLSATRTPDEPHAGERLTSEAKKTVEALKKKLEELEDNKTVLEANKSRVLRQQALLDSYGDNLKPRPTTMTGAAVSSPPAAPGPLHPESLSGLTAYLSLYASSSADLDAQLHSLNKQLRDLDLEIDIVRKNLDEANTAVHSASAEDSALRTVTVLVEAQADVEAELSLSYLVFNAGWSPYYDLRVTSDEQKLRINYKAEIRQYTGEDWLDANVALSTATPALGGDAPTPSRWTISIAPKYVRMTKSATVFKKMAVPSSSRSMQAESVEEDRLAYSSLSAEMMKMAAPVTTVEESLTTATYRVASRTNVPGDNVTHKVTVAIIDLSPKFLHFTYPRASEYVYLKAKVKNDSEYALLPGPASVFLDNNFVAKSTLDNVSPQETFECSLGVDPSIRVTRRPVVKTTETSGILSKSEVLRFTQTIDVKNTKTSSAKVVLIDQVPWSGDEKLKVTLIDPPQPTQVVAGDTPGERRIINRTKSMESLAAVTRDEDIELRDGEVQTRLNTDTNCLEWVVKLAAGKSSVLKFQYSIQYPSGEKVAGIV